MEIELYKYREPLYQLQFNEHFNNPQQNFEYITKQIRHSRTYLDDKDYVKVDRSHTPPGMYFYNLEFPKVVNDSVVEFLNRTIIDKKMEKKIPGQYRTVYITSERDFIFDAMTINEVIEEINFQKQPNTMILFFINQYVKAAGKILKLTGSEMENFKQTCNLVFIKYKTNNGVHQHIDKVWKGDGPIFTYGFNIDKQYYDMQNIYTNDAYRIVIPSSTIIAMDGISRIQWTHGLPFKTNYTNDRFCAVLTSSFKRPYIQFYDKTFEYTISQTIIPTKQLKGSHFNKIYTEDDSSDNYTY